ncbi:MAG: hypothetical protein R3D89_13360 [Sphingomonadaceae bacterium]
MNSSGRSCCRSSNARSAPSTSNRSDDDMKKRLVRTMGIMTASFGLAACATIETPVGFVDNPEPGLQGQQIASDNPGTVLALPYSKGVRVVGHSPVSGRDSNVQMVWAGDCAYLASSSPNFLGFGVSAPEETFGIAVIDVSDPSDPKPTGLLRGPGSIHAAETVDAVTAPDGRMVLAAGAYHNGHGSAAPNDQPAWLEIYDISDCANPKKTAQVAWPDNSHTVTISPDGRYVYGTTMNPFTGAGGLQVMDISDMAKPRFVGKFEAKRADGSVFGFAAHEITFSADGRRIYAGVISSKSDHFNDGIPLMPPSAKLLGNEGGGVLILDNSDFVERRDDPELRLVSAIAKAGWHAVMPANIAGVPHLVGGPELTACPATWPVITNIADEANPSIVGEFKLAMNRPENCPRKSAAELAGGGIVPSPGTATLHYNDVDSASDTRLGLFNFMWAGLRIANLTDPANPTEIAYFKPGDACTGHVRYRPESGHIWLTCAASGFWVLELSPQVRKLAGLPRLP